MNDQQSRIFRKAALDRLSSPEQLDRLVVVEDARGWVAALGLLVLAASLTAWGFLGRIATDVPADGLLVIRGGQIVGATSAADGRIQALFVTPGDTVRAGDPIADLSQEEAQRQLANARALIDERAAELARRINAFTREAELRARHSDRMRAEIMDTIRAAEIHAAFLEQQVRNREALTASGFSSREELMQLQSDLGFARVEISEQRARLLDIDMRILEAEMNRDRELAQLEAELADAGRQADEIETGIAATRRILAPKNGRVTEVAASVGAVVGAGTAVALIETGDGGLEGLLYIPTAHGKSVRPGMAVRLTPASVRREEDGAMLGTVTGVTDFPVTPEGMRAVLHNEGLVQALTESGPPYAARVELHGATTPSGFAWTSGNGPAILLTSGTTVSAQIEIRSDPPIALILPLLRRSMGLSS